LPAHQQAVRHHYHKQQQQQKLKQHLTSKWAKHELMFIQESHRKHTHEQRASLLITNVLILAGKQNTFNSTDRQ
jgi:hypothetical protein